MTKYLTLKDKNQEVQRDKFLGTGFHDKAIKLQPGRKKNRHVKISSDKPININKDRK